MDSITQKLQKNLKNPMYLGCIADYLLKKSREETQEIIDKLVDEGLVEESRFAKKYYFFKNNENKN